MFELMYEARGIGLAANQVDLPFQLFIINLTADAAEKDEEMVFINPVLSSPKGTAEAEEGCLSLVGINANVARPAQIHISAFDLSGNEIEMTVDGLLARAIQHEYDHLQGVLFIDRVSKSSMKQLSDEVEAFEIEFDSFRESGKIPDDDTIRKNRDEFEQCYC